MAGKPFPILFITGAGVSEAILSSGLIKRLLDEAALEEGMRERREHPGTLAKTRLIINF